MITWVFPASALMLTSALKAQSWERSANVELRPYKRYGKQSVMQQRMLLRVMCLYYRHTAGRDGSGGKSCHLAVGGLPVRSHPGRVKVSLSKTPNPQLLPTSWLVPGMAANRCVYEKHELYSALDKDAI